MKAKITQILALLGLTLAPYHAIDPLEVDATINAQLQAELASRATLNATNMLEELSQAQSTTKRLEATEADAKMQPVKNGVKFLIKNKMKAQRQMFWNDHIGNNQFRLRIQDNNANNQRAWFVFDSRTKTIRPALKLDYVIANQQGAGFKTGVPVVVRPWRGEVEQRLEYYSGNNKNLRNDKGFCLAVSEGKDENNTPLIFTKCLDKSSEGWGISALKIVEVQEHKQPLHDGSKFLLRSRIKGGKLVYYANEISKKQYQLKARSLTRNLNKAYWVFDSRTNTIRAANKRSFAISNQQGVGLSPGHAAVLRQYVGDNQRVFWHGGKRQNVQLEQKLCLAVKGNSNAENAPLTWEQCGQLPGHGWIMVTVPNGPKYRAPHGKIWLKSGMKGGRAIIWWNQFHGDQYALRLVDIHGSTWQQQHTTRGMFMFDERTRTIRAATQTNLCMSYNKDSEFRMHTEVVMAKCDKTVRQKIRYVPGMYNNLRDSRGFALTPKDDKDVEMNYLWFAPKTKKCNTKWIIYDKNGVVPNVQYVNPPIASGVLFRFLNEHNNHMFALTANPNVQFAQGQIELWLQEDAPWDENQWFVFDSRTHTIRLAKQRKWVISHPVEAASFEQDRVGLSKYERKLTQRSMFNKQREIQDFYDYVMTPNSFQATDGNKLVWYKKHNNAAQRWKIDTTEWKWTEYPLPDGVEFQLRTRMKSHRALFWYEHIGSDQYRLRIRDHAPWDNNQWWVFDTRTHTIRPSSDRTKVLSNQLGHRWRTGAAAVVRPWQGKYTQMMQWKNGTIQNLVGKCLDVWGGTDSEHNHLTFYNCHGGANQHWNIDKNRSVIPNYPLRDHVKFQIKHSTAKELVLFPYDHIGHDEYWLRLRYNEPYDSKQWWSFDSRTKTVRWWNRKTQVLGTYYKHRGFLGGYYDNQWLYLKNYEGKHFDQMKWLSKKGGNVKNHGKYCMTPNSLSHMQHVMARKCSKQRDDQNWFIDEVEFDVKYPIADGEKFMIKMHMQAWSHVHNKGFENYTQALEWSRTQWHIGGDQYYVRSRDVASFVKEQWWTFDSRTKTIRAAGANDYVLSHPRGTGMQHSQWAVLRKWEGRSNQRVGWFALKRQQIRDTADNCLNVMSQHAQFLREDHYVMWIPCKAIEKVHGRWGGWLNNHKGSAFNLDTKGFIWEKYPLKNGKRFRIRTGHGSPSRPIYWSTHHYGSNQFYAKLMNEDIWESRQWWVFDSRTQTIRAAADRKKVLAMPMGTDVRSTGMYIVIREYRPNDMLDQINWFNNTKSSNIRNIAGNCFSADGNHHDSYIRIFPCTGAANQAWFYDDKKAVFPTQPLVDGAKFQIKSRMLGNKALFWYEHLGSNQYNLRIRTNDPEQENQWWTFDSRTHTIRAWNKRTYAISTIHGNLAHGQNAVLKPYTGQKNEIATWHAGSRQNVRNAGGFCLDVSGAGNNHHQVVIWHNCHTGENQGWFIDQEGAQFAHPPIKDGEKFQIRSRMTEGRSLYFSEHIGNYQWRLRIQDHQPADDRQWWVFDSRTKSIRSFEKRTYAISHSIGNDFRIHTPIVVREWRDESYQRLSFFAGPNKNLRPPSGKCLTATHNNNNQDVVMDNCVSTLNQAWWLDEKDVEYPTNPLPDGERFQIKSRFKGMTLMWHEHIGGHMYRLRIHQDMSWQNNQWWVFDYRTKSIRSWSDRKMAIGTQDGYTIHSSWSYAVLKPWTENVLMKVRWFSGNYQNIRDASGKCLYTDSNNKHQHNHVIWHKCLNQDGQGWYYDTTGTQYPKFPIKEGVKFQIKSKYEGHRALSYFEALDHQEHYVRVQDNNPYDKKQWWVYDGRTHTIRCHKQRTWALRIRMHAFPDPNDFRNGQYAVVSPYRGQVREEMLWHEGQRQNLRNHAKLCLHLSQNHISTPVLFYTCDNHQGQGWSLDQMKWTKTKYPVADNVRFQIRSQMAGGRGLTWWTHIGGEQYDLRILDHNPAEAQAWWVIDSRTRSVRADTKRDFAISTQRGQLFNVGVQVVIRKYQGEAYQKLQFHSKPGGFYTLKNPSRYCLTVRSGSNAHMAVVDFYFCQKKSHQMWSIDQKDVHFEKYPLKDDVRFQLKTSGGNKFAVYPHDGWGEQTLLRIQNDDPGDNRQWWVFDSRTRSIRYDGDRKQAISVQLGQNIYSNGVYATIRPFKGELIQQIRWMNSLKIANVRHAGNMCLHTNGLHHQSPLQWYTCDEKNILQSWFYDVKGIEYPEFPLRDGVKFQIKSKMDGNRALFWYEHIGSNQYRLRIRANDPDDENQWWTYDSRTHTIRAWNKRDYAIANQYGQGFNIGVAAVIRQYTGHNTERIRWMVDRHQFENNGKHCLDVAGGSNTHFSHVIFWTCHPYMNQKWIIDQEGAKYGHYPISDAKRFQIRTRLGGYRAIEHAEHIGSNQNILRIRKLQEWNPNQFWVFDSRTNSIRADSNRNYAISNQMGYDNRVNFYAVIRPWQAQSYQKMGWFEGKNNNIRNNGGYCLQTYGNSGNENYHLVFYVCGTAPGQAWFLDQKEVKFKAFPVKDNEPFQIKTKMKSRRALFWNEDIGQSQYRLRIQDNDPYNNRQWWFFDHRTHTIRANADKNKVISVQIGGHFNGNGFHAVVRDYKDGDILQKVNWYDNVKKIKTIRNVGKKCLDVDAGADQHHRHVIWYECHVHDNQGWLIDKDHAKYPAFPLKDGVHFQIRSKMATHRSLAWTEHIGSNQYRLRIQDHDPENLNQWFFYDSRTNTVRPVQKADYVIANQLGYNFNRGVAAVVRPFENDNTVRIKWVEGSVRNLQNNGGMCLDVAGVSNTYHAWVTFWDCHNGLNQAWTIDTQTVQHHPFPVAEKKKFQIKSKMPTGKALMWHEHIGSNQYRVRIQDNQPADHKQWWIFDKRTHSIRASHMPTFALSVQHGYFMREGSAVVIRPWNQDFYQKMNWFEGVNHNIRNTGGYCLDVNGGGNNHHNHAIFWGCHNSQSQGWDIDVKGVHFPKYPLGDGKEFQIKSQLSKRALFWHEHLGSDQYRLRARDDDPGDNKQWWVFDWRTKTIRASADRKKVISVQIGGNFEGNGYAAVIRPWHAKDILQKMRWFNETTMNIRNAGGHCLYLTGAGNHDHTIWHSCQSNAHFGWVIDTQGITYPPYPLADDVKFQIKSKMNTNRALYWNEHIGANQYYLRIRDNWPEDDRQWFIFDKRTHTIRAWAKKDFVLSNQHGVGWAVGYAAVIRPYENSNFDRVQWHEGKNNNVKNNGGMCLDVHSRDNVQHKQVTWWHCHAYDNQGWYIDQQGVEKADPIYPDGKLFQIRSRMPSGKALLFHEHIGNNQYLLRIQNHAVWDEKQWWMFDKRTHTIRPKTMPSFALSNQEGKDHAYGHYAVVRPFKNEVFQHMSYFGGTQRNIRNTAGKCLDVYGGSNNHMQHAIFYPCHNAANQGWWLDTKDVSFPPYPLKDEEPFQIKTRGTGNRALFYHEHIGSNQFRLRIRDDDPGDMLQWWIFDARTHTIRANGNKNYAISMQLGSHFSQNGVAGVVRPYVANDKQQQIRWMKQFTGNVRNLANQCMDIDGASNTHHRHIIWYKCHKNWNQQWYYDLKGIEYPNFPVNNGVKFQIRSKMQYHRALIYHEHIGGNQYRLRISDSDPDNEYQWWIHDKRTQTIRPVNNRNFVIANQQGTGFNIGQAAVIRPYVNENFVPIQWHEGKSSNLRNNGKKCLEVYGGTTNAHHQHVTFWDCRDQPGQGWTIDQRVQSQPKYPIKDGKKFQIRSKMALNRAITWWEHLGGDEWNLRIRDHSPGDLKQWFVFDHRTQTVRAYLKRSHCISNQKGHEYHVNRKATVRPYIAERFQKLRWYAGNGKNFRNNAKRCLAVHDNSNQHLREVTFEYCNNKANQGWSLDTKGIKYPRYPLKDGIIFQIKTRGTGNRALFWHEHIGSHQYMLRIQNNDPENGRQWWVFDWRSKTIRAMQDRTKVISVQLGGNFDNNGYYAVVRNFDKSGKELQKIRFLPGPVMNIQNAGSKCLDIDAARNDHHRHCIWYTCHTNWNQQWYMDREAYSKPGYPLADGVKFQIKSKMASKRALFWHEHIGNNQYRLRIRDNNPEDDNQWWTFDSRTHTIRAWNKRDYAISNQEGHHYNTGVAVVIRHFKSEANQRIKWHKGKNNNVKNYGDFCLDVHAQADTHHNHVSFQQCGKFINQGWFIDQKGVSYPEQPYQDGVKFQIRSKMAEGRALFWHEHLGNNQYQLRIRDHLPGEGKQWWTFDQRTHTIRAWERRTFAISNQENYGYRIGVAAVIRPWRGEIYQHLTFWKGPHSNLRNNGGKCLDVDGQANHQHRHVIFWTCDPRTSQQWILDRTGVAYPHPPFYPTGHKFQLKTKMAGNRALFLSGDIGNHQYLLRIHTNDPHDVKQWFQFDHRTKTIRAASDITLAMSTARGQGFTNGAHAVMRKYEKQSNQQFAYWKGDKANVKNNVNQCLDVAGAQNVDNAHCVVFQCHANLNQAWIIDDKAISYPPYPLSDGVKFQIRSRMAENRVIYMAEHIGGNQHRLRIRTSLPDDDMQWFFFDSRTKTIRHKTQPTWALSNTAGQAYTNGQSAVMRLFQEEVHQRIVWNNGKSKNIQNNGKQCVDVAGNRNVDDQHLIWWTCHHGVNQQWYVDQVDFVYPKNPIADKKKFQIKTRQSGSRPIAYYEDIGQQQYQLRLQNNNPLDNKQWWFFDSRTNTIRSWDKHDFILAIEWGVGYKVGGRAVLRPDRKTHFGKTAFYMGAVRNIRNRAGLCLDVAGVRNEHMSHLIWWKCHDGLNQAWYLDEAGLKPEKYPFKDGLEFRIISKMTNKRTLYWNQRLNAEEFQLRIHDERPWDLHEWFVFDSRTQTIRASADRNFAVGPRHGQDWTNGALAVIRVYKGKIGAKMYYSNGKSANLRNAAGFCLRVDSDTGDINEAATQFVHCNEERVYQGWTVSAEAKKFPKYPLADGVKFQIKTKMSGNRAIFWSEQIGGDQYDVRIRDNFPRDSKQWWVFDSRTKTIRAFSMQNFVLCIQSGMNWNQGSSVVTRVYKGDNSQWIRWDAKKGHVKNHKKMCMDVKGGANKQNQPLIWWKCHGMINQQWYIDQEGFKYPPQLHADGVRFQIKSKMSGWRSLYWAEHIGNQEYQLRIRNDKPEDLNQWWTYDSRTNTVRSWNKRNFAIANMKGKAYDVGKAVLREYHEEPYIRISIYKTATQTIRNNGGKCLDVDGGKNAHNRPVIFWKCHNGPNQGWWTSTKIEKKPPKPPKTIVIKGVTVKAATGKQGSVATTETNWDWATEEKNWTSIQEMEEWQFETQTQWITWQKTFKEKQRDLKLKKKQIQLTKKTELKRKNKIKKLQQKKKELKDKISHESDTHRIEEWEEIIELYEKQYQQEEMKLKMEKTKKKKMIKAFKTRTNAMLKEKRTQESQKRELEKIKVKQTADLAQNLQEKAKQARHLQELEEQKKKKAEEEYKKHLEKLRYQEFQLKQQLKTAKTQQEVVIITQKVNGFHNQVNILTNQHKEQAQREAKLKKKKQRAMNKKIKIAIKRTQRRKKLLTELKETKVVSTPVVHVIRSYEHKIVADAVPAGFIKAPSKTLKPKPPKIQTKKRKFTWKDFREFLKSTWGSSDESWSSTTVQTIYNRIKNLRRDVTIKDLTRFAIEIIHARRPQSCKDKLYAELALFVTKIVGRNPTQIGFLSQFINAHSKGKKLHPNVLKWIKHLEGRPQKSKPAYHDLVNFVRIAVGMKQVKSHQIETFVFRVVRPAKGQTGTHSDFWKRYGGWKQTYISGLKSNAKFMLFNSQNLIVQGTKLKEFKAITKKNYFFYDEATQSIKWLGDTKKQKSFGVIDLKVGSRIELVETNGRPARRQDLFFYDPADMKFHNFVKRDLCIAFAHPEKVDDFMVLANCHCHGSVSSTQELLVKYFEFDNNNGFVPNKKFYFRSGASLSPHFLVVSNDGSHLQSSQRYLKLQDGGKVKENGMFYWDSKAKCVRNVQYDSCIGYVQQGDSFQLVSLGDTEHFGQSLTDIKYDGQFIWLNDKVAQPQNGYWSLNDITVSLNQVRGKKFQEWSLVALEGYAQPKNMKVKQPDNRRNNGFKNDKFFTINTFNGQALSVTKKGKVRVGPSKKTDNEIFYLHENSKVIINKATGLALHAKESKKTRQWVLTAQKPTRSSSEYFTRPKAAGIIQMSSNKDYVWKHNMIKNIVEIVKGDGNKNWSTTGTFFKINIVGKRNGPKSVCDSHLVQECAQDMDLNESD